MRFNIESNNEMLGIELNSPINLEIRRVGDEQTPIVVIDDLLVSTSDLVREGCQQAKFETDENTGYPGIRSMLPAEYRQAILPKLIPVLYQVYRIPKHPRHQALFELYSLLTHALNHFRRCNESRIMTQTEVFTLPRFII